MKPNLPLFTALLLISAMLFFSLPEENPAQRPLAAGAGALPAEMAAPGTSGDLTQMRKDYALLLQEMARLRAKMEQTPPAPAENQRTGGLAPTSSRDDDTPSGVTIYLDTSKLPPAGNQGPEWTAVGFHDAGQAADGSKRAVVSITKFVPPQAVDDEPVRIRPVSRWQ